MKHVLLLSLLFAFTTTLSAQCVSGNCQNGQGTYLYPSGAKYVGNFANGEIHGVGVCYYTDGSKYSGQWEHRYPHGTGTKTFADGNKWTGNWQKGQPVDEEGLVIESFPWEEEEIVGLDMDIQTGCVSGDCLNGEGIWAYADGSRYEGLFRDGKSNGKGTFYDVSGATYEGSFRNNLKHGQGTLIKVDGTKQRGQWLDGEYLGEGLVAKDGEGCVSGNCSDGQGTYIYSKSAARYVGTFKDGLAHGKGICYYANGERYEGEWAEGSFNGIGTLFLEDGSTAEGFWVDGTYMGKDDPRVKEDKHAEIISEQVATTPVNDTEMKVWAVVVGVSSYTHMPSLRYTDDDAYRMFAFLKSPEGGALSDDQIQILIDEDATRENIMASMHDVFSKAGPSDLVMLYFSGHGLKGSFLPIDFDGFNNKVLHEEINAIFEQSQARFKLCIADACHSGSLFAMKSGTVQNTLMKYYKALAQSQPGTALIMSSKSDETSLESNGLRQGVFSHFFLRGLKGEADTDQNSVITVQELYDYVFVNVRSYTGMRQSPVIQGDYDTAMPVGVVR